MPKVEICPSNFFVYRPIIRLYLIYIIHYQYKKSIEVRKTYLVPQRSYYNNTVYSFTWKTKICVQHIISADLILNVKLDERRGVMQSYMVFEWAALDEVRKTYLVYKNQSRYMPYTSRTKVNRGTENVPRAINCVAVWTDCYLVAQISVSQSCGWAEKRITKHGGNFIESYSIMAFAGKRASFISFDHCGREGMPASTAQEAHASNMQ